MITNILFLSDNLILSQIIKLYSLPSSLRYKNLYYHRYIQKISCDDIIHDDVIIDKNFNLLQKIPLDNYQLQKLVNHFISKRNFPAFKFLLSTMPFSANYISVCTCFAGLLKGSKLIVFKGDNSIGTDSAVINCASMNGFWMSIKYFHHLDCVKTGDSVTWACIYEHLTTLRLLTYYDVNVQHNNSAPVYWSIKQNRTKFLKLLFSNGADLNSRDIQTNKFALYITKMI